MAARANAPWAWERLYRVYAPRLLGFLRLRDANSAEDVLGDTFVDVVRQLDGFDGGPEAFQSWLFRIARNRSIDSHRRATARPEHASEHVPEQFDRDVADIAIEHEATRRVESLLGVLPEDQRTATYLRNILGMSFAEVAAAMVRSEGSVKMLHGRALRTLAERLAPHPAGEQPQ